MCVYTYIKLFKNILYLFKCASHTHTHHAEYMSIDCHEVIRVNVNNGVIHINLICPNAPISIIQRRTGIQLKG